MYSPNVKSQPPYIKSELSNSITNVQHLSPKPNDILSKSQFGDTSAQNHAKKIKFKPSIKSDCARKSNGTKCKNINSHLEPEVLIRRIGTGGVCLVCNRSFTQANHCRIHYIKTHGEDGGGGIQCIICNTRFQYNLNLRDHMMKVHKVSTNLQRYQEFGDGAMMAKDEKGGGACLKCGRYFTQFNHMKIHFNKACTGTGVSNNLENFQPSANYHLMQEPTKDSMLSNTMLPHSTFENIQGSIDFDKGNVNQNFANDIKNENDYDKVMISSSVQKNKTTKNSTANLQYSENSISIKNVKGKFDDSQLPLKKIGLTGLCLVCNSTFAQYRKCKTHYIKKHGENGTGDLECLICKAVFRYNLNLKDHMKDRHKISTNLVRCEEFGDGSLMAKDEKGGGACLKCGNYYTQFRKMKVHFYQKCLQGADAGTYNNLSHLENHSIKSEGQRSYFDNVNVSFNTAMNQHDEEMDLSPKRARYSTEANEKLLDADNNCIKKEHMKISVTENGEGLCEICGEFFDTLDECKSHYSTVHDSSADTKKLPKANQVDNKGPIFKPLNIKSLMEKTSNSSYTQPSESDTSSASLQNGSNHLGSPEIKIIKKGSGGICLVCNTTFTQYKNCRAHYITIHGEDGGGSNICMVCNQTFNFEQNLRNHLKVQHKINHKIVAIAGSMMAKVEGEKGGVCLVCHQVFTHMKNLKDHYNKLHMGININENTGAKFDRNPEPQHLAVQQMKGSTAMKSEPTYQMVTSAVIERNIEFPTPNTVIETNNSVDAPESVNEQTPDFKLHESQLQNMPNDGKTSEIKVVQTGAGGICLVCNKSFTLYQNCRAHYISKHGEDGGGSNVCLVCNRRFNYEQNLRSHMKMQHKINHKLVAIEGSMLAKIDGGDGGVCLICHQVFTLFQNLKVHYTKKHAGAGLLPRTSLNNQMTPPQPQLPVQIKEANTEILNDLPSQNRANHIKSENKDMTLASKTNAIECHKPIKNEVIDSLVSTVTELKKEKKLNSYLEWKYSKPNSISFSPHESNINLPRPDLELNNLKAGTSSNFSCQDIDYIFDNKREKSEPSIQISKTDFGAICLVCEKTFSQLGNCKVHFMSIHAEDGTGSYLCIVCETRFNFEENFRNHMRKKHQLTGNLKRSEDFGNDTMMAKDDNGSGVCLLCRQVFSQYGNLKVHYKAKHVN